MLSIIGKEGMALLGESVLEESIGCLETIGRVLAVLRVWQAKSGHNILEGFDIHLVGKVDL